MSNPEEGRWAPCPPGAGASDQVARHAADADALPEVTGPVSVVGLGAICDLRQASEDGRSVSFSVSEFASLGDGRRVILHRDRGFTIGWGSSLSGTTEIAKSLTSKFIARDVLNVVLPDDDESGEDHPWAWLADLARSRGLNVTAEDLERLPYEVVLTDRVTRMLSSV